MRFTAAAGASSSIGARDCVAGPRPLPIELGPASGLSGNKLKCSPDPAYFAPLLEDCSTCPHKAPAAKEARPQLRRRCVGRTTSHSSVTHTHTHTQLHCFTALQLRANFLLAPPSSRNLSLRLLCLATSEISLRRILRASERTNERWQLLSLQLEYNHNSFA